MGRKLKEMKARTVKANTMIRKYKKKLDQFPSDDRPPPLPTDMHLNEHLLTDSALWELDQYSCTDKWARDCSIQRTFKPLHIVARAKEEVVSLLDQCRRYINWHKADLGKTTNAIRLFNSKDCLVRQLLLNRAQLTADNLRPWKDLQAVINIIQKYKECDEELLVTLEGFISPTINVD